MVTLLEGIVKTTIPFVGTYRSNGFDKSGRISIPVVIVKAIMHRHDALFDEVQLFYRTHNYKNVPCIEITDLIPSDSHFPAYRYEGLDDSYRITIKKDDLEKVGIEIKTRIVILGNGNSICILPETSYSSDGNGSNHPML